MNAYETGKYRVYLFDKHGTKQETVFAENLTSAMELGEEMTQYPPHASFVVTRVLHNSLDSSNPWSTRASTQPLQEQ